MEVGGKVSSCSMVMVGEMVSSSIGWGKQTTSAVEGMDTAQTKREKKLLVD